MNRLQVGGLALIVGFTHNPENLGKVVKLDEFIEYGLFCDGSDFTSRWKVSGSDLVDLNGNQAEYLIVKPKHLLPLGDKQTQDEIFREEFLNTVWVE